MNNAFYYLEQFTQSHTTGKDSTKTGPKMPKITKNGYYSDCFGQYRPHMKVKAHCMS